MDTLSCKELILWVNFISVSSAFGREACDGPPGVLSPGSCTHVAQELTSVVWLLCSAPAVTSTCPSCSWSVHQARPTACRRPSALPHSIGLRRLTGPRFNTSALWRVTAQDGFWATSVTIWTRTRAGTGHGSLDSPELGPRLLRPGEVTSRKRLQRPLEQRAGQPGGHPTGSAARAPARGSRGQWARRFLWPRQSGVHSRLLSFAAVRGLWAQSRDSACSPGARRAVQPAGALIYRSMEAYTSRLLRKTLSDGDRIIHHSPGIWQQRGTYRTLCSGDERQLGLCWAQTDASTTRARPGPASSALRGTSCDPQHVGRGGHTGQCEASLLCWRPRVTGPLVRRRALHESGGDPRPRRQNPTLQNQRSLPRLTCVSSVILVRISAGWCQELYKLNLRCMWETQNSWDVEKAYAPKHTGGVAGISRSGVVIAGRWGAGTRKDAGGQEETAGSRARSSGTPHRAAGRHRTDREEKGSLAHWSWVTGPAHQDTVKSALSRQRELLFYSSF